MRKRIGLWVYEAGPPAKKKIDLRKPMIRQNRVIFRTLGDPFFAIRCFLTRARIHKVNMEGVKPPFILICNHNAFNDFYVMVKALKPFTGIYPAAVDDFIGRELFLRCCGCVPKRKYTSDLTTVLQCKEALEKKQIFGIYAEARYSLCGVTETDALTESLGQLVKLMGVPCVTMKFCGHHIFDPFWGNHVPRLLHHTDSYLTQILSAEEVKEASSEEINKKIRDAIYHDDWRWQNENRIVVKRKNRAEGLHKPLYMCPACKTEYKMNSEGAEIFCEHCGKRWTLDFYGELHANEGETEFKFPSDWYLWEKECVTREVEEGRYYFECDCYVNDLPNSRGFICLGKGRLIHDLNGFRLDGVRDYDGDPFKMHLDALAQNSIHVEYNYRFGKRRDCIDLNSLKDTYYVFPENCEFSVTKITFATEAIYKKAWREKGIIKKKR